MSKRVVKNCAYCGKKFYSRGGDYCSKQCRSAKRKEREDENGQLCWNCKNACGGCSWSKCFKPVEGWGATPTTIDDNEGNIRSYRVHSCPEFIWG